MNNVIKNIKGGNYVYTLINAVELNKKHPDTFHIPSYEDISKIKIGDVVKLGFDEGGLVERMWVTVTAVDNNKIDFVGKLDNSPVEQESVKYGDLVTFKSYNVYSIW